MKSSHLIDVLQLPNAVIILDEKKQLLEFNSLAQIFFQHQLQIGADFLTLLLANLSVNDQNLITSDFLQKAEYSFTTVNQQRVLMTAINQQVWLLQDQTIAFNQAQSLEEQQRHLIHSAKLASVGEMASGIAHEINNPLAIIQAKAAFLAKLLSKSPLDLKRFAEDLDKIQVTCQRISKITKSLQTLTRSGDDGQFVQINIVAVVKDTLEIFQQKMKNRNINFELSLPETLFAEAFDIQIGQVLVILMNNAIDAVTAQPEAWIKLTLEVQNRTVLLTAENSGQPLPMAVQARLGQAFFSTKEPGKGTGLGVSIAKKIMAKHGGALDYDSTSPHPRFKAWWPQQQGSSSAKIA